MTLSVASRTGEVNLEDTSVLPADSVHRLHGNGSGSRDSLAILHPTSAPATTDALFRTGSLCENYDGVSALEDSQVLAEEEDTSVVKESGRETLRQQPEKEEEEENGVPYDRGWSWMVVLGMFVNFVLLAGYVKSSGLFFVELLKRFNAPATHTALLFAIRSAVLSISGLYVMNVCLGIFGSRKLVFTGGLMMALSAVLSSVANELTLLICIYSTLLAIGMSMLISPGEVLIGHYFKKRRSLALALAKCGASVGNVAIPPLVSYLLTAYGLSGTLLLLGGVCLHCLPAAMLLRPTSFYTMRHTRRICCTSGGVDDGGSTPQPLLSKQVDNDDAVLSDGKGQTIKLTTPRVCKSDLENTARRSVYQHDTRSSISEDTAGDEDRVRKEDFRYGIWSRKETLAPVVTSTAAGAEDNTVKSSTHLLETEQLTCRRHLDKLTAELAALSISSPEICLSPPRDMPLRKRTYSEPEPQEQFDQAHRTVAEERLNVLNAISQSSVVKYMSLSSLDVSTSLLPQVSANKKNKPRPTALKSVDSSIGAEQPVTNDNSSTNSSRNRCVRFLSFLWRCPKKLVFMLDFSLFRSPLFRLLIMYMMFFNFVNIVLDYLPAVARENGVTESQSALLLSIIGGLDLLSRLLSGFLADTRLLRVPTMIIITLVIMAVVTQFVRFMTTFDRFVIFAAFQGLFGGVGNCLFPVLIIEFVGLENMGKGIGFCQLVNGAVMAAIYPFLGYLRDVTGSFTTVYHVIGVGMLVGAGLLCLEGPVRRLESRSQYKVQTQGQDAGRDFELVVDCDSKR